jgi:hypothetical protein
MSTVQIDKIMREKVQDFVDYVCRGYANEAEQYAKENAPWTDRTSAARRELHGYVIDNEKEIGFGVAHRVDYGPALEEANDGQYAILRPTVDHFASEFLAKAKDFF